MMLIRNEGSTFGTRPYISLQKFKKSHALGETNPLIDSIARSHSNILKSDKEPIAALPLGRPCRVFVILIHPFHTQVEDARGWLSLLLNALRHLDISFLAKGAPRK